MRRHLSAAALTLLSAGVAVAVASSPPVAAPAETIPPLVVTWEAADPTAGLADTVAASQAAHDEAVRSYLEAVQAAKDRAALDARRRADRGRRARSSATILACENRSGSYTAENPTSTASGRYQFVDGTFSGTKAARAGGYTHAADAPPEVQDAAFAEVWNGGKGSHHWRECGG